MAVIGTFGSFTAARLGIYASQASLNVTGNNIANINTEGYTRQRMDLVSLYSYGTIRYANSYHQNIGYGVLTQSVSQLRDPFLDIRFREENSNSGAYEAKLDCLDQLAHILDEVGKGKDDFGIIAAQFEDFLSQLNNFHLRVGSVEYDTAVRGSAQTLTRLFNDYSKAMDILAANKLGELKENVKTVNALLTQIRDLSVQIRDAGIVGDNALELRDQRNLCIDKLSTYMKINVTYDEEKIDEFNSVERINITIADSGNPPIKLIQGVYGAQISMPEYTAMRNPYYDPNAKTGDESKMFVYLDDNGDPVYTNLVENPDYDENNPVGTKAKYMRYNGDGTRTYTNTPNTGEEVATQVPNAVEGDKTNRLWMSVEPLTDVKGRYMRDEYHKEITAPVLLSDTQLYGSLQSIREFLTEKGEFSSDEDLLFDKFAAQKRGIQYYQNALDALAKKFAEAFNTANQLNIGDVSAAYQVDDPDSPTAFIDKDGNNLALTDSKGNSVGPEYFDELAEKMERLETLQKWVARGKLTSEEKEELQKKVDALTEEEKNAATQDEKDAIQAKIGELTALIDSGDKLSPEQMEAMNDEIADLKEYIENETPTAYKNMEILRNNGKLTEEWDFYNGGVLFSSDGDTNDVTGITAGNITISKSWSTHEVRILNTKKPDILDHSTADDNIYHMIALMSQDMNYLPNEILDNVTGGGDKKYFTGSFAERLADMNSILAVETNTTTLLYNNYTATTLSLENSRQSVAGVDLNDEATNMMVFQKAYAAACQLMTTLDSMLDKLINGTLR